MPRWKEPRLFGLHRGSGVLFPSQSISDCGFQISDFKVNNHIHFERENILIPQSAFPNPKSSYGGEWLILVPVFERNIVLGNLFRRHFRLVGLRRIFHAFDHPRLERLTLFDQLFDALGIPFGMARQSLGIT
jgi:hypothetical protein